MLQPFYAFSLNVAQRFTFILQPRNYTIYMKLMLKTTVLFVTLVGLMLLIFRDELFLHEAAAANGLEKLASLPREVNESSGLAVLGQGQYLTHNDAGNSPNLYLLNAQGKLQQTISLRLPNVDWEDLTQDAEGNIYIADTGNNENDRRELAVYKLHPERPEQVQAIRFSYEDQTAYPPKKKQRNFDSEAIFWSNGKLYLISKDRGRGETAKVYQLPDQPGTYKARLIGSHNLKALVTGAAISPDGKTVALVSEEELHLFRGYSSPDKFYEGQYEKQKLDDAGQTEAVAFEGNNRLVLTSEGGNLYYFPL